MSQVTSRLTAAIFDVDGVLLASPHERAWREALVGLANPARFTTAMYQAHVAGKPRLPGALAALQALGVANAAAHADIRSTATTSCAWFWRRVAVIDPGYKNVVAPLHY
jgi:hypothetical protein